METLRVSASDIDAYRRFRQDDEAELADLLAQLRRETPPSAAMMAGTALHAILENMEAGSYDEAAIDGYSFRFEIDGEIDLPAIREMKATREYVLDGAIVTLVGKVDAVSGKQIDDHKFTGRYDPERFLNSYQWRIYLEVFGADRFRWNVLEGRESPEGSKRYRISALHPLTAHRYPGMGEDVRREVGLFLDFARRHLPEKIGREAA